MEGAGGSGEEWTAGCPDPAEFHRIGSFSLYLVGGLITMQVILLVFVIVAAGAL